MPLRTRKVVGIDVGGARKGFHAVAMADGIYLDRKQTMDTEELVDWCCRNIGAVIVAVDAPCRWSRTAAGRPGERELLARGIRCFLTPTRAKAAGHPTGYYEWMLRGVALFSMLEKSHALFTPTAKQVVPCCFETFPHAIAWHLQEGTASASRKRHERRSLLRRHGCNSPLLANIDWVDAALCALAADTMARRRPMAVYGEEKTGYIVVPALS